MEYKKVIDRAKSKKGSFASIVWERPLKTRKAYNGNTIVKRTYGSGLRMGVNYDNMKAVQEYRKDGVLPSENQGLISREWIEPNLTLRSLKTGKTLLRVSMASNSSFRTEYFLNGKPTTKETIEQMVLASEVKSHDMPTVFDVGTDNIIAII